MPTLCLTTPGTRAHLVGERLRIEPPPVDDVPASPRDVLLTDIERVVVSDRCTLTLRAIGEFLRREIPIVVTSRGTHVLGMCLPPARHSAVRLAQYRMAGDGTFCIALAIALVEAKILNSRRVLQRLAANREQAEVAQTLVALERLASETTRANSLDVLRGYEGTAAGKYFEAYGRFFPDACPFERRSRRPPHNPPNAILSYTFRAARCSEGWDEGPTTHPTQSFPTPTPCLPPRRNLPFTPLASTPPSAFCMKQQIAGPPWLWI